MKAFRFYSAEQVETLKKEINSGKKVSEIAKRYAKEWNRSSGALLTKIITMRNEITNPKEKKKKGRPAKIKLTGPALNKSTNGITLKSGFVFDFSPVRAEMHADHVRLYF